MLLQFSVANHRSIKNKAVISMKATKDSTLKNALISPDGKKEIVPVLAIYGANAAEKNEQTMETEIYALTDFSPRKGENLAKGYLQGRYGAIPFIGMREIG